MATLRRSNGSTIVSATLSALTIRAIVHAGLGQAADSTHQNGTLNSAAIDAMFAAATAQNPISLGLELIREVPSFYPERL